MNPRGLAPVPTDAPSLLDGDPQDESIIHVLYRDGAGTLHQHWPRDRMAQAIGDQDGLLWVDFRGSDEHVIGEVQNWLQEIFRFHHLAVEDALQESHIPKVDDWGSYLYLVFHVPTIDSKSDTLELQELDVFLGHNYLVTYHTAPLEILDQERGKAHRDPRDRLRQGADYLLFLLLESAVDRSLIAIEQLDVRVDEIQNLVIEHPNSSVIRTIFRIKRSAIQLHKNLGPQREVLNKLARDPYQAVQAEHRVYFRDLYDHVVRTHDISESLRDLIAGTLETYLSVVSNRTNDIMKTLTMVTVMFLPMSFLAGFFGMNFFGESLTFKAPLPKALFFVTSCVIMAISPCFMWILGRRKKWF
jgi:magnesium transporter